METTNPDTALQETTPRRGAQRGNRNALRHGMRAALLPPGCGGIENATDQLRIALEDAVLAAKGQVDLGDAASISTAVRAERLAALASKWLRDKYDTLSADARLSYAREVVKASEARDRAIRALGIDAKSVREFEIQSLYSPQTWQEPPEPPASLPAAPDETQRTTPAPDAPAATPSDSGGSECETIQTRQSNIDKDNANTALPVGEGVESHNADSAFPDNEGGTER